MGNENTSTFYAKVVENIGSMGELDFGTVGTVIKVINGYYYDKEGDIWVFETFEDLVDTTSDKDEFQTRFVLSTEEEYNKYWEEEIKITLTKQETREKLGIKEGIEIKIVD